MIGDIDGTEIINIIPPQKSRALVTSHPPNTITVESECQQATCQPQPSVLWASTDLLTGSHGTHGHYYYYEIPTLQMKKLRQFVQSSRTRESTTEQWKWPQAWMHVSSIKNALKLDLTVLYSTSLNLTHTAALTPPCWQGKG